MERLTFEGDFCDIAQCAETRGGSFCEDGTCSQRKVWERLKAYEDTGLTPERCAELAKADKEGRLVVLPCKVGDTVYLIYQERVIECIAEFINMGVFSGNRVVTCTQTDRADQYGAVFEAFGKTVFLTNEEAEQALKEAKEDG